MKLKEFEHKIENFVMSMASLFAVVCVLLTTSCTDSGHKGASTDSAKTGEVRDTAKVETINNTDAPVEKQAAISYEGRDDIVLVGDMYCKISYKGKKLIVEWLDEKGNSLKKEEKPFEDRITKTICYDGYVYVVVDMLEEGEYSKLPFIGLYKVDLKKDSWEFLESTSYITFDTKHGKAKLKTADGLAGESEADGFLWKEKTINL